MLFLIILLVGLSSAALPQSNQGTVTGKVINSIKTPLANCNISIKENNKIEKKFSTGTITDSSGKFSIHLPFGSYILTASYVGYETHNEEFTLSKTSKSKNILIELKQTAVLSKEVTVTGEKNEPSTIIQRIEPKDLHKMPTIYNDVLRAIQILPGVTTSSELSSGYNVRGGSFDDNLIYLNGFEIYRPFLLRLGVEENKTLPNPDLVEEFRFYNGSFPASYGDKMSSALDVKYDVSKVDSFSGSANADFLSAGLTLKNKTGNLKYAAAVRYAYPGLFLNELQTNGDYRPAYKDIQFIADYPLSSKDKLEILLLYADNKFDLTPTDWEGNFGGFMRGDYRGVDIFYNGERKYTFKTGLAGIKYSSMINNDTQLKFSAARYSTTEDEYSNVASEYYYLPDPKDHSNREYIKSAKENVNNNLDLVSYELIPELKLKKDNHLFSAGLDLRLTDVKNKVNEAFSEDSDSLLYDLPSDRFINDKFRLNSYSGFLQDDFKLLGDLIINAGVRTNYYEYNKEFLVSPRASINYIISSIHSITFSWGYYYQPPSYPELRNKEANGIPKLKAQRSVHYAVGWEYKFKEKLKFNLEAYYNNLSRLIPYYIDREKTEYLNANSDKGYAYGFDLAVQGEIVEGLNSWIGYGYLNTKERTKLADGTYTDYRPRLTDQNQTIQIFLQDRIKKHPNWQSHFRLLFGSGYLYNNREIVKDPETGKQYIKVSVDKVYTIPFYFRVDMGLSANFDIGDSKNLVVIAEVFNLFDHKNYGGYRFIQIPLKDLVGNNTLRIVAVPQILSKRFFNLGLELKF